MEPKERRSNPFRDRRGFDTSLAATTCMGMINVFERWATVRRSRRSVVLLSLLGVLVFPGAAPCQHTTTSANRLLYCAYGIWRQQGWSGLLMIAIVQVSATHPGIQRIQQVPSVELLSPSGDTTTRATFQTAEEFLRPPGAGPSALYDMHTAPWDRTLSQKPITLRIRATLPDSTALGLGRCRITVGPLVIEGPVNGSWPTG